MPPPGKTPDAEMAWLAEADQSDRNHPKPSDRGEVKAFAARDESRLTQARDLLMQDQLKDPHSFDKAGLIFQHGRTPDDFLMARELVLLSCFLKATYNALPALAEDRYLVAIGRPQRFGGDRRPEGGLFPVDEMGDTAVTDALRLDCFMPPLSTSRSERPEQAAQDSFGQAAVRIQARWKPDAKGPDWITDLAASPADADLRKLEANAVPLKNIRKGIMALYRADRLRIPSDYRRAASLLLKARANEGDLLLANELAMVAVMRSDGEAWPVFAASWDDFAHAIGQPSRYGTRPGEPRAASIAPAVLRALESKAN